MWLRSDNIAGVDPAVFSAMEACNSGVAPPYGDDALSSQLDECFSKLFATEVTVFPVPSGTAANALALASIAGPFDVIACHENAHPLRSESGATTFFSGGAQFLPVAGTHGRVSAGVLAAAVDALPTGHGAMKVGAITVTQLTEAGTAYSPEQLCEVGDVARARGLLFHMDGARFANAVAALDVAPAQMTWRAGVDLMSFGGTKNGTMCADAVIFFNRDRARNFAQRLKRSGHALSKTRFMAAQLLGYVESGRWLANARHANAMARQIATLVDAVLSGEVLHPVEGNIVFAALASNHVGRLEAAGFTLRSKGRLGDGREMFRLVTSFQTDPAEVARFGEALQD